MSKEFKHTPGPHHCHWDADDKTVAFVSGNGAIIAEMVGPDKHRRANAKLFSTSLELLEALEFCVEELSLFVEKTGVGGASLPKAKAAIAKARGE